MRSATRTRRRRATHGSSTRRPRPRPRRFPAASGGEYNLAGWNAGCATSGLCGTYGDGSGSGVSQVQVSIRRGAGNYWNGTAFASGVRGLEHGDPRRRQLVVRLPRLQLPGRRQLHGARARGRRGVEHADAREPHVHLRRDEPERPLHVPGLGRQLHDRRVERRLRDERLLRHALRHGLRRRAGAGLRPPRLDRQLLERHLVRVRLRGLPDRHARRRATGRSPSPA